MGPILSKTKALQTRKTDITEKSILQIQMWSVYIWMIKLELHVVLWVDTVTKITLLLLLLSFLPPVTEMKSTFSLLGSKQLSLMLITSFFLQFVSTQLNICVTLYLIKHLCEQDGKEGNAFDVTCLRLHLSSAVM